MQRACVHCIKFDSRERLRNNVTLAAQCSTRDYTRVAVTFTILWRVKVSDVVNGVRTGRADEDALA